jgi:predicted ATP-dependent endonuclease of OLD family
MVQAGNGARMPQDLNIPNERASNRKPTAQIIERKKEPHSLSATNKAKYVVRFCQNPFLSEEHLALEMFRKASNILY